MAHHLRSERTSTLMDDTRISNFLAAVDNLRGEDETVRATAHTSSISADGWTTTEPSTPAEAPAGTDA
jgi:hypothetical protein